MEATNNARAYPPDLLPFLPLLYVVWEDGILTDAELLQLRERLERTPDISEDARRVLRHFLDPSHPPSADAVHDWRSMIEAAVQALPSLPASLTELAQLLAPHEHPRAIVAAVAAAATEIGLETDEAVRAVVRRPEVQSDDRPAVRHEFDPEALCNASFGDQLEVRERTLALVRAESFAGAPEHNTSAYREWVFERIVELGVRGFGRLGYPKDVGGDGDQRAFMTAFETIALRDLSVVVKFGVQFGLFGGSIQHLGAANQTRTYLPQIGRAELPGCFAMTETGHGSNVRQIETVATYRPDDDTISVHTPSLSARKDYIGNAARHGRLATVFAQLRVAGRSVGVHAFLVPIRDEESNPLPGVTIEDCGQKMGLNGVDNGRLSFDNVVIPRAGLLSRFGSIDESGQYASSIPSDGRRFFTMLSTLVGGRISVALAALSAAKSGLSIAVRYAERRKQFGPKGGPETPIMDYLTHQRRLLPLVATAYALHFSLHALADDFVEADDDEARESVELLASGFKCYSSDNTTHTLQTARECCGGQGYLWENRLAALKADTDIFTTFEGDNTVLYLQVSKSLLGAYGGQFAGMDLLGYVRHFGRIAATSLKEKNPIAARTTDADQLRSHDNIAAAMRYRVESLTRSAAARLKSRIDAGQDSFEAFVECQDHLVEMSSAHVEHELFDRFRSSVGKLPPDAQPTLDKLVSLFGLSALERERGWFLEQSYFEPPRAKAVRREVNALLGEIRPHSVALIEGFGIPDDLLRAPIAV